MQHEFLLTRSNYYNQNFNTAIFFDPFRIYFNNVLESAALDLYYHVQKHFEGKTPAGSSCYILIYPDVELFEASFGATSEPVLVAREGTDFIIGVKSITDLASDYEEVIDVLEEALSTRISNA
jgi:hypothetical protein